MGAVAGLLAGAGLILLWLACTTEPPQWRSARQRRLSDLLVQAGVGRTSPGIFVAGSVVLGAVVALGFLGASRAWPSTSSRLPVTSSTTGLTCARARRSWAMRSA